YASPWREPRWNADRCAPPVFGGAAGPVRRGRIRPLRLSAFCFRFFFFRSYRHPWPKRRLRMLPPALACCALAWSTERNRWRRFTTAVWHDSGVLEKLMLNSMSRGSASHMRKLRAPYFGPRQQLSSLHNKSNPGPSGEDAAFSGQPGEVGSTCPAPECCGSAVIGASNLSSSSADRSSSGGNTARHERGAMIMSDRVTRSFGSQGPVNRVHHCDEALLQAL